MSILEIEMTPDMEQRLREKAKRHGLEAKPLAQTVILLALHEEDADAMPGNGERYNVMDFYGVGREALKDLDVQKYLAELRGEWER